MSVCVCVLMQNSKSFHVKLDKQTKDVDATWLEFTNLLTIFFFFFGILFDGILTLFDGMFFGRKLHCIVCLIGISPNANTRFVAQLKNDTTLNGMKTSNQTNNRID